MSFSMSAMDVAPEYRPVTVDGEESWCNRALPGRLAPRFPTPSHLGDLLVATVRQTQVLLKSLNGAAAMRRLLPLAALVFALWAIDSYVFHNRYQAIAVEDINYYAQILNDGVQRFVKRLSP